MNILPDKHRYANFVKKAFRQSVRSAGFRRISPSIVQPVSEEAFGVHEALTQLPFALNTDMGASTLSLILQQGLIKERSFVQLYTMEPVFRFKGEAIEQKWQYGLHIAGADDPALMAETIRLLREMYKTLGIDAQVDMWALPLYKGRVKYETDLKNYYFGKEQVLCKKCRYRLDSGRVLRLLECECEDCRVLAKMAPSLGAVMDKKSVAYLESLQEYLTILRVPFAFQPWLVAPRADEFELCAFRLWTEVDGQRHTLGCGGVRTFLAKKMGHKNDVPYVSYIGDMLRAAELLEIIGVPVTNKDTADIVVVTIGESAKKTGLRLIDELRREGYKCVMSFVSGPIKTQLELARQYHAPVALVLGEMEAIEQEVIVRDTSDNAQTRIPIVRLFSHLRDVFGEHGHK